MADFKLKIEDILSKEGFKLTDNVRERDETFEDVVDYCMKLSKDNYDHELIDTIQMYKYNNLNISDVFLSKLEMRDRSKSIYEKKPKRRNSFGR